MVAPFYKIGQSPARGHSRFFLPATPETDQEGEEEALTIPRGSGSDDPWDDEPGPTYDPEDIDGPDQDDEEPTITCPYCRREIHEDSERCPYCESSISKQDAPARKPWWIILGVAASLYVVYHWIVW